MPRLQKASLVALALTSSVLIAACDSDEPESDSLRSTVTFRPSLVAEAVEGAYARGELANVGDLVIDQNCGNSPNAVVRVEEASVCGGTGTTKFLYVAQAGSAAPPTGRPPYALPAPVNGAPPTLAVVVARNIRLAPGKTLLAPGGSAIVLFALESITIEGTIDVGPAVDTLVRGAGAAPLAETTPDKGAGVGGGRSASRELKRAAGGGTFCGIGGGAVATGNPKDPGAAAYGTSELVPLVAGSDGGSGVGKGGAGGGAIALIAGRTITIAPTGVLTSPGNGAARGDFGVGGTPGLGGGSGGAILLEALTITMNGVLAANGGTGSDPGAGSGARGSSTATQTPTANRGGAGNSATDVNGTSGTADDDGLFGGGGGGAGRIRLNGRTVTATGSVSPALTTPCGTQGGLAAW